MKKVIWIVCLTSIVLWACAPTQKATKNNAEGKPEWLLNPQKRYPDSQYLVAIGEADTHQEAQNMAASNLSKIFEMEVKADETTMQRASEIISSKGNSSEDRMEITKNVNIFSSQKLLNVKMGESYTNQYGRVFSLAYLNRFETAAIYENQINENSENITDLTLQAERVEDPLKRYAFWNGAALIAETNEVLLRQLGIISIQDKEMMDIPYNKEKINQELALAAKAIPFQVSIKNDSEKKIEIQIQEILTEMGFVTGKAALMIVKGKMNFEQTDLKREDGFVFVRYDFQVELLANNEVVAAYSKQGREGHLNQTEAQARIYTKLTKTMRKQFKRKIEDYFIGLIK